MSSNQLKLAAEIMAEYEQGKNPRWEGCLIDQWHQMTGIPELMNAIKDGYKIRRIDPYQKFKDALAAGERVRYRGGHWGTHPDHFAWGGSPSDYEIESDWSLPPPPPGRQWMLPAKWTKDMLPDGYRPMLIGEMGSYEYLVDGVTWTTGTCLTVPTNDRQRNPERTNRPLPSASPLTAADVPFGARFRYVGTAVGSMAATITEEHIMVLCVDADNIYTYKDAAYLLEMSTDGINWKPCTK